MTDYCIDPTHSMLEATNSKLHGEILQYRSRLEEESKRGADAEAMEPAWMEQIADLQASLKKLCDERNALVLQLSEAERKGKDLCQMNGELLMTLHEIARGAGPYSRDPLEHATNTIEAMKQLAKNAIAIPEMRVGRPLEGS